MSDGMHILIHIGCASGHNIVPRRYSLIRQRYVDQLGEIPMCVIEFTLISLTDCTLRGDLTPTLRGAIGWAFSEVGCLHECSSRANKLGRGKKTAKKSSTKHCEVERCPFERAFNGGGWPERGLRVTPQGYRLSAPIHLEDKALKAGDELLFSLTLFGEASQYAPMWISAVIKATMNGLTSAHYRFYVAQAKEVIYGKMLYERCDPKPPSAVTSTLETISSLTDIPKRGLDWSEVGVRVRVHRPLILREIDQTPTLKQLCRASLRRAHGLYNRFVGPLEHPLSGDEIDELAASQSYGQLHLIKKDRYSSTKRGSIPQNGFIGERVYTQIGSPLWVYKVLSLAAHQGLGQQTNMGLGSLDVELIDLSAGDKVLTQTTSFHR